MGNLVGKLMLRLFFLAVIVAGIWWANNNGVLESLATNFTPKPGKKCEIAGPFGEGVWVGNSKDACALLIDSNLGTAGDKLQGAANRAVAMKNGELAQIADHTKIEIIKNDKVKLYGNDHAVVEAKVLSGDLEGTTIWLCRDDVIDTPLQEWFQSLRQTKLHKK